MKASLFILSSKPNKFSTKRKKETPVRTRVAIFPHLLPNLKSETLRYVPCKALGITIQGPTKDKNGFIWWKVRFVTGKEGWVIQKALYKTKFKYKIKQKVIPNYVKYPQRRFFVYNIASLTKYTSRRAINNRWIGIIKAGPYLNEGYIFWHVIWYPNSKMKKISARGWIPQRYIHYPFFKGQYVTPFVKKLNCRENPSLKAKKILVLSSGTIGRIEGGPKKDKKGNKWWYVVWRYGSLVGKRGWVVERYLHPVYTEVLKTDKSYLTLLKKLYNDPRAWEKESNKSFLLLWSGYDRHRKKEKVSLYGIEKLGRHVTIEADKSKGKEYYRQCVDLSKSASKTTSISTWEWLKGKRVIEGFAKKGDIIATFVKIKKIEGIVYSTSIEYYSGHTAIFWEYIKDKKGNITGFWVIDSNWGLDGKIRKRAVYITKTRGLEDASIYFIVRLKK